MTEPTEDPLFDSTLRSQGKAPGNRRATLPCLTVLGHTDPARLGERAAQSLLVGQRVEVSRTRQSA